MFTIALIGFSNVGKTSLFNKLTHTNYAFANKISNFTFDFNYGILFFKKKFCICIDTCGLLNLNYFLKNKISRLKLEEIVIYQNFYYVINNVDLICLLVDSVVGVTVNDIFLSKFFLRMGKKIIILISKVDLCKNFYLSNFFSLGVNILYPISIYDNNSILKFLNYIFFLNKFKKYSFYYKKVLNFCVNLCDYSFILNKYKNISLKVNIDFIKVVILGKPNVGKSTLLNRIIKYNRSIVSKVAGTTKDLIMYNINIDNVNYLISDSPGLMKFDKIIKSNIFLKKIFDFKIILYIIDISIGISKYDLFLLNSLFKEGKCLILIFNKCDTVRSFCTKKYKNFLSKKYDFIKYIDIYFISASKLYYKYIINLFKNIYVFYKKISLFNFNSSLLTKILKTSIFNYYEKNNLKNIFKLKYAHIGGYNPLTIIIHGTKINLINYSYKKYLINFYISELKIKGFKIFLKFKEINNPYLKCN